MGFYYIRSDCVSVRRGRGHATGKQNLKAASVGSGDIIVANSSSYVDILYLTFRFAPLFTQIASSKNEIRFITATEALLQCGQYPVTSVNSKTYELKEAAMNAKAQGLGPIVVFPEATTSNGRALLKFVPLFKKFIIPENEVKIHVLALKYEYNHFSPTYTVGNKAISNSLSVKWLAPNESPSSPTYSIANTVAASASAPTAAVPNAATDALANDGDALGAQLLTLLGGIARLRKTSLGVNDKKEFLDYYFQRTGATITKGAKSKKAK
ncbi:Lysophosphatidic acid:oleoyl-CoA acyltransferase 1 [Umbelopsis sp. WA50703]